MVRNKVELLCTYKHYLCFCDGQFWWWFIAQFSHVKWKINEIWASTQGNLWIFQYQIFNFRIASDLFPIFYASGNELYFWKMRQFYLMMLQIDSESLSFIYEEGSQVSEVENLREFFLVAFYNKLFLPLPQCRWLGKILYYLKVA